MQHKNREAEERHEADKRGVTRSLSSFVLIKEPSIESYCRGWYTGRPVPGHSLSEETQVKHLPFVKHPIDDSERLPHDIVALSKKSNGAARDARTTQRYFVSSFLAPITEMQLCSKTRRDEMSCVCSLTLLLVPHLARHLGT